MRYIPLFVLVLTPALTVGFTACPNPGPGPVPPTPNADASLDAGSDVSMGDGASTDSAPAPNPVDAGPVSSSCASACATLAAVSCPIGQRLDCAAVLTRILGTGKIPNKATGRPLTCDDVKLVRTQLEAESEGFTCQ